MSDPSNRYPLLATVEQYLRDHVDGILVIAGTPPGRLVVQPSQQLLALQFPSAGELPALTNYRNVHTRVTLDNATMWDEVAVQIDPEEDGALGEAYALLLSMLDRVQVSGETFREALWHSLETLSEILALRRGLSRKKQVGLFGELLVLLALIASKTPDHALSAWRGPLAEEHDFGLLESDLEVKTTTGEFRRHWISSSTQLVPTPSRVLYLISIQLTSAGSESGLTLPSLVDRVRGVPHLDLQRFNDKLLSLSYSDSDSNLYQSAWLARSEPAFFLVDDRFPALTQTRIEAVVPDASRILDLRYRLDLTGMSPSPALIEFPDWPLSKGKI